MKTLGEYYPFRTRYKARKVWNGLNEKPRKSHKSLQIKSLTLTFKNVKANVKLMNGKEAPLFEIIKVLAWE